MRQIVESVAFQRAAEAMGGYRAIDLALEPIIEALYRNPFGFERFENDWTSFRYARTKEIKAVVPALVVVFTIDQHQNVILEYVEEDPDTV